MVVLFIIVFLSLIGFGIVLPPLPFIAERMGASPTEITLVLGLYSVGQFFAAPIWGRISDSIGRKPVLVISLIATVLGYVALAFADTMWTIGGARLFAGLMAGNIAVAFAYVTDVTTRENRAKGMGILGAAAGMGFVFGPAIGGLLAGSDPNTVNFTMIAGIAAVLAAIALVGTVFVLKESLPEDQRRPWGQANEAHPFQDLTSVLSRTVFLFLIISSFLIIFGQSLMETTFALFSSRQFGFGPREVGLLFGGIGMIAAIVQGGGMAYLAKRFSERNLTIFGVLCSSLGLAGMGLAETVPMLIAGCIVMAIGFGVFSPALSSLVSHEAGEQDKGVVMGVYQASQSLGRMTAPLISGAIFSGVGINAPMLIGALLGAPCVLFVLLAASKARTAPA